MSPRRSWISNRKRGWFAAGLLAAACTIGASLAAPRIVETWAAARVREFARKLPGTVEIGPVALESVTTLTVQGVTWARGTDWSLKVGPTRFDLDLGALVWGGSLAKAVQTEGVTLRLGDPDHPLQDFAEIQALVRPILAGGGPGGIVRGEAALGAWPLVNIERIEADIHVRDVPIRVREGRLSIAPREGSLDASEAQVHFETTFWLNGEGPRVATVEMNGLKRFWVRSAAITVTPPITWTGTRGTVGAKGLSWQDSEVTITAPRWASNETFLVEAEAVRIRYEKAPEPVQSAGSGLRWLPDPIATAMRSVRLTDITVERPVCTLQTAGSEAIENPRGAETHDGAFRSALRSGYEALEHRLEKAREVLARVAEGLPSDSIQIHGASLRLRVAGTERPDLFAHVDARITRDPTSRDLAGRFTFENPETSYGANEASWTWSAAQGATVSLRIRRLPLAPYAGLVPSWFLVDPDTALKDCEVSVRLSPDGHRLDAEGALAVEHAGLYWPAIASVPMRGLSLGLRGRWVVNRTDATVRIEQARLAVKDLDIGFTAEVERLTTWPRLAVEARIERIRADDLLNSLPPEAFPGLEGVKLAGSFSASASLQVDTQNMEGLKLDVKPDVADLTLLDPGRGLNLDLLRTEFFHRIDEGKGRVIERVVGPSSPSWVALDEVPRFVVDALTTSEDSQFFEHHGFSLGGIRRSLRVNLERGGFYQGASTLSQQLAKNLFLSREKTLARKIQEAFITWQLERYLSKEKILELYLNVVEWGPEVFGLREAAIHYFGKNPSELNPLEAAYLVSILPNPLAYHRHFEQGFVTPQFERRVRGLLSEMVRRGLLSEEQRVGLEGLRIRFVGGGAVKTEPQEEPEPIPDDEFSDDG